MKTCLETQANQCIKDVKEVMKKHGLKGKVRLILALSVLKCLDSGYENPWHYFYNKISCSNNDPFFSLVPKYFEKNVFDEIISSVYYHREEKYSDTNIQDVMQKAIEIAKCSKKKNQKEFIGEIISLSNSRVPQDIPF